MDRVVSEPRPAAVRGNDWRQVEVPPLASFRPRRPVSVVVPYYEAPEALGLTLAALEGQTYPRELFEVVVVDDGSRTPLPASLATTLDARVVHQEDRGFGANRARNTGARAARHDILVFLDCDMMPEAEWLAAHARWHHVVSDALTLGSRAHVEVDGIDAAAVRGRKGTLAELFMGRPVTRPEWVERIMRRTDELTSIRPRDSGVVPGNVGVSRGFFEEVGAYDEELFTEWGGEDTELGWRAFNLGGLLVPAREALCWHQGAGTARTGATRHLVELSDAKVSHLLPFHWSRRARAGRSFTVPRHVVSIEWGEAPVEAVLGSVERVLADRVHDLVVWVEERCDDFGFEGLRRALEPDPRVYFGPAGGALDAFPAAAFHVTVPAGPAPEHLVHALEARLGTAVAAEARLATGTRVALCRAWALHRARRSGKEVADFGSVLRLDPKQLGPPEAAGGKPGPVKPDARSGARPAPRRSGTEGEGVVARATYPLGAEIAVVGERAAGVFAGSGRVGSSPGERHVDIVLADTLDGASDLEVPVVALDESPPRLSVPAFDPETNNPVGWVRAAGAGVAALGALHLLPPGVGAERVAAPGERGVLGRVHHVEDVAAFHADVRRRAGTLAALAGRGVVVHVADPTPELEACLGAELFGQMVRDGIAGADPHRREAISIRMRRAALREHSLRARARQVMGASPLPGHPLPEVSVLLATKRPAFLPAALAGVAAQSYPRLELVLALHGEGFGDDGVNALVAGLPLPVSVVRVPGDEPLGAVLNAATSAASGLLLTKLDDDDHYGRDHVWDLVLAHEYSRATLVGKAAEYVYLRRSNRTIHRDIGRGEDYGRQIAGGTFLISRHDLHEAGGWRRFPTAVDVALIEDVRRSRGRIYRTHGAGYLLVRRGSGHTWQAEDAYFIAAPCEWRRGLDLAFAGIDIEPLQGDRSSSCARRVGFSALSSSEPRPAAVRGNDWRQVEVPPLASFRPRRPVSVVVPYYEAPEALGLTLAALEGQTYPRELFEVVVVDDGSRTPLPASLATTLDARVVHQEDRGFGANRARNTGARAARHDILVFLDCDMMPEAEWLAAHARWHHVVSDALTLGSRAHVEVDGIDAAAVRGRKGTLAELFMGRPVTRPEWVERIMRRTDELTSIRPRDSGVVPGNVGVSRGFFEEVGAYDESFTEWGGEDTELGWRAFNLGGLLVPAREALCWHQGAGTARTGATRHLVELSDAKVSHLLPFHWSRRARAGRSFTVPRHVVSIEWGEAPVEAVLGSVERVLADRVHDLVVWVEERCDDFGFEGLRRALEPDPRVYFGPAGGALDAFPAAAFHVTVPAGPAPEHLVHALETRLGVAVAAEARLATGARVALCRAWALHRARRSGKEVADFGDVLVLDPKQLDPPEAAGGKPGPVKPDARSGARPAPRRSGTEGEGVVARATYPLGAEIAVRGESASGVFAGSGRVESSPGERHVDIVLADTLDGASDLEVPVVALDESPPRLSVPAFDPETNNPVGWVRAAGAGVAALGALHLLPPGVGAERVVAPGARGVLGRVHHVEDVAAFHAGVRRRTGTLAALAGRGVVVHVADPTPELEACLGAELFGQMVRDDIAGADPHRREAISIRMRRAALREHSLRARARQVMGASPLPGHPLPEVSVLLATKRPAFVPAALAGVAAQSYPRLELVLALHGEGFGDEVAALVAGLPLPVSVVRVPGDEPLGAVLNAATSAASGLLLTKFDDDDRYGRDHVWDLVLAHEYSRATLVGKPHEYTYLACSNQTIRRHVGSTETHNRYVAGGTFLISGHDLHEAGGWRRVSKSVDAALIEDVERSHGRIYRTHGAGYLLVRHGSGHTWQAEDAFFIAAPCEWRRGLDLAFAGIDIEPLQGDRSSSCARRVGFSALSWSEPRPAAVRGNDWRQVEVPPLASFRPRRPVSVVVPYYEAPEALGLTLAALEGQTYPRELFEVVVVDDGSRTPLPTRLATTLDARVMHQGDRGFGAARARNTGARAARHDILVFLDCDMMPEAEWLAAHARWHHVVSDALTVGFLEHVEVDGVDATAIRRRKGTLADLFAGRPATHPEWIERVMRRTDDLTLIRPQDSGVVTGNMGVSRGFFEQVGAYDESFTEWGGEDTELGWRAFNLGGLLVPARDAFCWHQGLSTAVTEPHRLKLKDAKVSHLMPFHRSRRARAGRSFAVPKHVVSIEWGEAPVGAVLGSVERVLADRVHDLVVWVEERCDDVEFEGLRRALEPDPRVYFGPAGGALAAFPAAAFHVTVPAGPAPEHLVHALETRLGTAVAAEARLATGARVALCRAWALHRARRSGKEVADFGSVLRLDPKQLGPPEAAGGKPGPVKPDARSGARPAPRRSGTEGEGVVARATYPLGAEIAVVGERAAGVFAGSGRVGSSPGERHVDVVLADTLDGASELEVPVVALDESPPRLSVPAFDPETNNPVGWVRAAGAGVAALGALHLLPPGVGAERVAAPGAREVLGRVHHVEDVAAFHVDVRRRAGTLAALAGRGVVVHVADPTPELEACLGAELFGQMVRDDIAGADPHRREAISIRMRRAALREHSLRARARQVMGASPLPGHPLPEVSVLLATRRPALLPAALAGVAAQSYPRLELVLALHGEGFGDEVNALVAGMPLPVSVVRVPGDEPLGAVLNAATSAAGGLLLTKLDDDDHYGRDHVWDLVLAHEYSRATLVGKGSEYVYLRRSNRTVHRFIGRGESRDRDIAGATFLISRYDLHAAGGWRRVPEAEDRALIEDVERSRGRIYRTHGAGFLAVRHGSGHAWQAEDARFTAAPCEWRRGLDLAFAGIDIEPLQGDRSSPCARRVGISALSSSEPRPAAVRGNDWRQVEVPPLASFRPRRPVSVVVPCYEAPEALGLTLAALEGQTYPRELFEVVVVDDGSRTPLPTRLATPLNARVVHQEDREFGLARARNTGARAARHDILVFLDCDMMPEAEWLSAHARWHHVVSDALTLGFLEHVEVDGIDAAAVRRRKGTLADLFAGRPTRRPEWIEDHMRRTNDLLSPDDRLFGVVTGGQHGMSRAFFEEVGAYDESFAEWGGGDTEFGWRAFNFGGLLVPAREALCWHQGAGTARTGATRHLVELSDAKVSHLLPFHWGRRARAGRSFTVPRHVVSIEWGEAPVEAVLGSVERVLADRVHDLVVWVEERCDDFEFECLRRALEPDPRVYFGPAGGALAAFPAAAFHVTVPAGPAPEHLVHALETRLGAAVAAEARLATGARVALCRAWALHRARRSGKEVADFGDVLVLDPEQLAAPAAGGKPGPTRPDARSGARPAPRRSGTEGEGVVARATYPLGAEIAVVGERAAGVLAGSGRVESSLGERHVDIVLADTLDGASDLEVPVVALDESPPRLSVPAFDPETNNPRGWVRDAGAGVAALGALHLLPPGIGAERVAAPGERGVLGRVHHVEDVAAFHADVRRRASTLAALAGRGVVVHVADPTPELEACLGAELFGQMVRDDIVGADPHRREAISIRMRRAALREHSLRARARQVMGASPLPGHPLPEVSVLLATKRPAFLPAALAGVAAQSYPRLELVLALHGEGFGDEVNALVADLPLPVSVVRVPGDEPLGAVLNAATSAAAGLLLTKFDDDDHYGRDHVWDLVLAHEYSRATLVGKPHEYTYLARSNQTVRRRVGSTETHNRYVAGATSLISRHDLYAAGGWRRVSKAVDAALIEDVERSRGRIYRTHGAGFLVVRHGSGHAWQAEDAYFLRHAAEFLPGLDLAFAGIDA